MTKEISMTQFQATCGPLKQRHQQPTLRQNINDKELFTQATSQCHKQWSALRAFHYRRHSWIKNKLSDRLKRGKKDKPLCSNTVAGWAVKEKGNTTQEKGDAYGLWITHAPFHPLPFALSLHNNTYLYHSFFPPSAGATTDLLFSAVALFTDVIKK